MSTSPLEGSQGRLPDDVSERLGAEDGGQAQADITQEDADQALDRALDTDGSDAPREPRGITGETA